MEVVNTLANWKIILTLSYLNDVSGVEGCINFKCAENNFERILTYLVQV